MKEIKGYKAVKEFKGSERFMPVDVYRSSFNGLGRTHNGMDTIYIPCDHGFMTYDRAVESAGEMAIFYPEDTGVRREHWALKPVYQPVGMVGPMSDGNLAYSSDSRITKVYHIHDRFESNEMYQRLST